MIPRPQPKPGGVLRAAVQADPAEELLEGLRLRPRTLPCKFFYDRQGSMLFERITTLEEYYASRTEKSILRRHAGKLTGGLEGGSLLEIGSGDCSKISILLDAMPRSSRGRLTYVPVDVSPSALEQSRRTLKNRFGELRIRGLVADFTRHLDRISAWSRRTVCFFGSTLGNLDRHRAGRFIARLGRLLRPGERLLLGLDMVKDRALLEPAYNDEQGITARFNKNILKVCNRLAGTDFDPGSFHHRAFYHPARRRIEMHLVANRDQTIRSPRLGEELDIRRGESIHTENSHKFTPACIREFAGLGRFSIRGIYSDPRGWFSLAELVK